MTLLGLSTWLWPALAVAKDELAALLGKYRHSGGDKEHKARDAAIDAVVAEMNVLVRAIARGRLKATNPIAPSVSLSSDGDAITVVLGTRSYRAPRDGRAVKVKGISGDEVELRYRVTKDRLEQRFAGEDGGRVNTFALDGDALVMRVRVFSPKLPKDLSYKLTYARS
jgi:hypothetical protein